MPQCDFLAEIIVSYFFYWSRVKNMKDYAHLTKILNLNAQFLIYHQGTGK